MEQLEARERIAAALVPLVEQAGAAIMAVYRREFTVEIKSDDSPLTEADLASHHVLVAGLEALTPTIPIVSEESAAPDRDISRGWSRYWLIDPLDGTKEFVNRNGQFTVNVALIEDNEPTLGAVGVPAQERIFLGDVTRGTATLHQAGDAGGLSTPLSTRPAARPLVVVASRSHGGERLTAYLDRVRALAGDIELESVGSALKLCLLAEGVADFYPRIGPTSEWDIAAAQAVLEAAGGRVCQLDGSRLGYNKDDILNPDFLAIGDPSMTWLPALLADSAGQGSR